MPQPKRSREEWAALVAECNESGLSAKAFAEREGLKLATLRWWMSKLGKKPGRRRRGATPKQAEAEKLRALPVTVVERGRDRVGEAVEVAFGDLRLVFPTGTDATYVGEIFLELRALC